MSTVTRTVANHICLVTMNRPEALNAFSTEMMDDLCEAFLTAAADSETKVLVLTGAGRAFSSGADLKSMGVQSAPPKHGLKGLLETIIDFPKPFLIAANGLGVGIGCTILGLADVAFAAASAKFKCPFSALGLTAEAASTITFPNLMGHQQASWTLLSSEWLTADVAQATGLVLSVFPDEDLMTSALGHAETLAALPLASLIQTKALLMRTRKEGLKAAVAEENAALDRLVGGPANREAVTAFQEKRLPDFRGL